MTITTNPSRDEYTSTAGQTVFNYTFKIYANTDLNVYVTPSGQSPDDSADLTTDYVVDTGTIGEEAGGFITFNTPLNNGDAVTIVSAIPYDRTVDYQNNGDFLPETVNDDNDRQVSQIKQILEQTGRTLQFQESLQGASTLSLPDPVSQNFMRWKTDLTGLENVELVEGALVVGNGQLLIFPTVAALKASTSALLVPGVNVQTQGYYSAGDGGGANYLIVTPQSADEYGDHTLVNGNVASIQVEPLVKVKSFGVKGDGVTDDTIALAAAKNHAETLVNNGEVSGLDLQGARMITSSTITFDTPMVVEGGNASIWWENSGNADIIYVNAGGQGAGSIRNKWVFRDITIAGGDGTGAALHIDTVAYSVFENINIPYCGYGVVIENSLLNTFKRVVVSGIAVSLTNPDVSWIPIPAHRNRKGFFLFGGGVTGPNANTFIQCGAQNSTDEAIRCIGGNNSHFIDFDSEGHTGNHLYADGCLNLQFTGGDFEGVSNTVFIDCTNGGITGAFHNNVVRVEGDSNSVVIKDSTIKIITIQDATCENCVIDNVTLYTGASGITNNGTNTRIGRIYDQDTSDPYFGNEWFKTGQAVINVGGTTTGHTITSNSVLVQRSGQIAYVNIDINWTSLNGTGDISFDITSLVTTAGAESVLSAADLRVTIPAGYSGYTAKMTSGNLIALKLLTNSSGTNDGNVSTSDVFGGSTGVSISGVIRLN